MNMMNVKVLEPTKNAAGKSYSFGDEKSFQRIRVAAYCRVSTDDEEQKNSFESQKKYYEQKIAEDPRWIMAGIFADEAITGTKVDKRVEFQRMIQKCLDGEIDMIVTKSISRFSRNTQDTLRYVRLLKEKRVAILFENENINTLDMKGEMLLTVLSSLAQQDVETTSSYVKSGLKMKMKRGEMIGFNGCYGYDYHSGEKSISVNKEEAEIVKLIFQLYCQGYGGPTIARRLNGMGIKNKAGKVAWTENNIRGIISNEKYKGDLLQGKTFTVDPLSKRRLKNRGEEEKYLIENHHEAIVSREMWDEAQAVRKKRAEVRVFDTTGNRERYVRQYAFSSMIECGYCGHKLSRRSRNQTTKTIKSVWQCRNATKNGIKNCPHCKAIDERIIEDAFLDAMHLLIDNFDDVMDSVLDTVEEVIDDNKDIQRVSYIKTELKNLHSRKLTLTDLLIDGKINDDDYEAKNRSFDYKIHKLTEEQSFLEGKLKHQENTNKRLAEFRSMLKLGDSLDQFDRMVFESVVEKVIVGGFDEENNPQPYKLTFIFKTKQNMQIADAKAEFKRKQKKENAKPEKKYDVKTIRRGEEE